MGFTPQIAQAAVKHLRRRDKLLAEVIKQAGAFTLKLDRNRFGMLVRSILSQQISTSAANSIRRKLEAHLPDGKITAENLSRVSPAKIRTAGVSPQKAGYLTDLVDASLTGRIRLDRIGRKDDEGVIEELIQVKGIGRWTAQMFLIFSLGRLDVFPFDDLGVRAAIRNLHGLAELPNKELAKQIAAPWSPYASVASWYCWRSLELNKPPKKQ